MKNRNTLSVQRFIWYTLLFSLLFAVLFRFACFSCLQGMNLVESKIVYWALLIVLIPLGTLITVKKRRNLVSMLVNISLPFEIYAALSTYRYITDVYTAIFIVTVFLSVGYLAIVMTRKAGNRNNIVPIMRKRIKFGLLGVRTIATVMLLAVTFYTCSGMLFGYGIVSADVDSDITDSRYGEWTIENHIETLVQIDEAKWRKLSVSEKMNVLGVIKNIEMRKFGINHEVYLVANDLERDIAGSYNNTEHRISLDIEHVKSSPPEDVVRTLLHESMHVYQHMCVDLYDQLDDGYKNMPIFRDSLEYKKDFANYVNGDEDFELYYNQTVEASAREYAELISPTYFYYVDEFLIYGNLPTR